jgi:probable HAF family extracellular repeat protein
LVSHAALFHKGLAADLGVLKGSSGYSRANGINASGQVVGFSGPKLDGSNSRAFSWNASTGMLDLGTLGGAYAQAYSINDSGFITGNSEIAESKVRAAHAFIYEPSSPMKGLVKPMRDLGTLGGRYSYGTVINADNHVVGYSTIDKSDNRIHAFLYDGAKMRDLGSLGGKTLESDRSFALGVNSADEVVGYTYLPAKNAVSPSGPIPLPRQVAFIYHEGVMVDLNALIGDAATRYWLHSAVAINDKGQIAANAVDSSTGEVHAVMLTPTGVYVDVDTNSAN